MRPITLLCLLMISPAVARAEHAKITLEASAGGETKTAFVDQTPPDSGKNPRPLARAKAGEAVRVSYMLTNVDPHKSLPDVVVHFYVARQVKAGQAELPSLADAADVVLETAFAMDFKPGGKAGARATFRVDKPGVYLVRVETGQTGSDHEHFAAIDLVVE